MGCDYYKSLYLCIEYLDNDNVKQNKYILLEKDGGYFLGDFDSDFMSYNEYFEKMEKLYPDIYLYKDSKWLCLADAIYKYKKEVDKLNVKELIIVRKSTSFMLRM
jgi:hypothetical protein